MKKFKVVKIVDEYLIVINYGHNDHAQKGDILEIVQKGEEVKDPETNESLGTLDVYKGTVKVKNVYEKMSLCISNEYVSSRPMASFTSTLANLAQSFSHRLALKVNTEQVTGGYDEDNLTINLLDPVNVIKSKYLEEKNSEEDDKQNEDENN